MIKCASCGREIAPLETAMYKMLTMVMLIPWWFGLSCETARAELSPEVMRLSATAASKYHLDVRLVRAIIVCESGGNVRAVSKKNCVGLMQLKRETWAWIVKDVLKQNAPWGFSCATDAECNIEIGCAYLRWLTDYWTRNKSKLRGTISLDNAVVLSYNCGQGNVGKARGNMARCPKESRTYLARVTKERKG